MKYELDGNEMRARARARAMATTLPETNREKATLPKQDLSSVWNMSPCCITQFAADALITSRGCSQHTQKGIMHQAAT